MRRPPSRPRELPRQAARGRAQGGDLRPGRRPRPGQGAGQARGDAGRHPGHALRPRRCSTARRRTSWPPWSGTARKAPGAFLDLSTGSFFVRRWRSPEEAVDDLRCCAPARCCSTENAERTAFPPAIVRLGRARVPLPHRRSPATACSIPRRAGELLLRQFGAGTLRGFGLDEGEPAVRAAAAALAYAQETQKSSLSHVRGLAVREARRPHGSRRLDPRQPGGLPPASERPLEAPAGGGARSSPCSTAPSPPPGGRTLREWLRRPLVDPGGDRRAPPGRGRAGRRTTPRRERLRERLARVGDPERLLTRAVLGTLTPARGRGPARQPRRGAGRAGGAGRLDGPGSGSLAPPRQARRRPTPSPVSTPSWPACWRRRRPPASRTAASSPPGSNEDLDRYRSLTRDSKRHILALEIRERERTGISSLKIRYNKVFGYYLEVTRANQERVPADYIRKQTLVNAERYVTPEIKELEEQILSAEERQIELEQQHLPRAGGDDRRRRPRR